MVVIHARQGMSTPIARAAVNILLEIFVKRKGG